MLSNLFKASIRSLKKNASSAIINLGGLMLGLSAFLIIGIYLHHELTYDQYHKSANRIFRLTHNEKAGEIPGIRHVATVGPPVGPELKKKYAEVEDAVRFRHSPECIMKVHDKQHYESRVYFVDPSVFDVFSFSLASGNSKTALSQPNNVIITKEIALKYFGDEDPIGKQIRMNNSTELVVTGVLHKIPSNTHLKFDFLLPFDAFKVPFGYPVTLDSWGWISFHTYVLLKPGTSYHELESKLVDFTKLHWPDERYKRFKIQLQPLGEIYLGEVVHENISSGNKTYLYVLAIAGVLILIVAGFNFANLYTAICISRAKEMGIRKILGAQKHFISRYIIVESIALTSLVALFSLFFLPTLLHYLSTMGFQLHFPEFKNIDLLVLFFSVAIIIGLVSSIYPSGILSSFHHHYLLKGVFRNSKQGIAIRSGLIFLQYCITIALLASVLVIQNQMNFLKTKDLGYAQDELLLLRMPPEALNAKFKVLQQKFNQNPNIMAVSLGGGRMDGENGNVPIYVEGNEDAVPMSISSATFDFFKTIGIRPLVGREISVNSPADTLRGVLLNEEAVKAFGWTLGEALGKKIRVGDIVTDGEVIGVIPDFNFGLLRSPITPLVMYYPRTHLQDIYIRFNAKTNFVDLISSIEQDWKEIAQDFPFDYIFLNEHLDSKYETERQFSFLFHCFAYLAILISCLGLFAVISQDVAFRIKEIAIRKTLGATISNIWVLLVKPFIGLIVLAGIVATPASYWVMDKWLSEFSFHISIGSSIFIWATLTAMVIAISTVSYKVINAGIKNPVDSLRSE